MLTRLYRLRNWLLGADPEAISFDRHVFLMLTLFSVAGALAGLAINIINDFNFWATLITAIAPLILLVFYLAVRKTQNYHRFYIPLAIIFLLIIVSSWFTNAGYDGNILILIYIIFAALYITARDNQRSQVYILFLVVSSILIILSYVYPGLIIEYDNKEQRFYDLLFGNILYLTFLFVVMRTFISGYNRQAASLTSNANRLIESEEKYRLLVEQSSDPVFSYTLEGRHKYANQAFADTVGMQVDDIVGKTLWEVFSKEDAEKRFETLNHVFQSGEVQVIETYAPHLRRYFQTTISPIRSNSGELISALCLGRDITERRLTELALQDSYSRLRHFFNQSMYGWYSSVFDAPVEWNDSTDKERVLQDIDQHQFITEINDTMLEQYAAKRENLVGRPMSTFFEHDKERGRGFRRELFDKGHLHVETFELKDNNTPVWIEGDYVCTYDEQGRITGTFGIQLDVSERKKAEKERERLQEQLTQTQKMETVGRLAGGVAHDFNNMLQAILGHIEVVIKSQPPEGIFRDNLLEIQTCARRSADLTRQLLAFARKQTIIPIVLDLNSQVESILKMLQRLIGEDIELVWLPAPELWPVKMDPMQLDQILTNLCLNARDAIAGVGKVTIQTENRLIEDPDYFSDTNGDRTGEFVTLVVNDNGHGMDTETLSHLFEPFYTTKEVGKGTGLGLAMIYGVIQQNNGHIKITSEPNKGSTFELFFARQTTPASPVLLKSDTSLASGGRETILVVEDEPAILNLVEIFLEEQGYNVLLANNPTEAIELAEQHIGKIDLLLTDVIMPVMNGWDLSQLLHSRDPNLKCVFMSAYSAEYLTRQEVLAEGVFFIEKPFVINDLCLKVREAIDHHSKERVQ